MKNEIELYYKYVIKPMEKEMDKLKEKINSKKFSDFLNRNSNKRYLKIYEQLLDEKYVKLCDMISEENAFMKQLFEKSRERIMHL